MNVDRHRVRRVAATVAVLVLMDGLLACAGRTDAASSDAGGPITCAVTEDTRVGIATGNATGVYYELGSAYAEQIDLAGGRLTATAAETGASVQNIEQVVAGRYQVAFSLADVAADAVNGTGGFATKQPIVALARIHTNYTQVIVRTGAGIEDVAGLRGKRVSTGSPKSGTEVIADRILKAAGLDPAKDISARRLDLAKTVEGMEDGSIDALFWSGGLPTPAIADLLRTEGERVRFLDVTSLLPSLQTINAVYEKGAVPAAAYGTRAAAPAIVVPNFLVVRRDLDPNVACVLTRILFDRKASLVQANPAADEISLKTARQTVPVPLHRGAVRALDDLGAPQ